MAKREIIVPTVLILLAVLGFAGYDAWKAHNQKQVVIDPVDAPGCDVCSMVKKDLAEQVRLHKQQSGQTE